MIQLVGVPTFAGALYPGTDETPKLLRECGLQEALELKGLQVQDAGDVVLPAYLPRHNVPPVRNWPAPRMVWEAISAQGPSWFAPDKFNLLLGGDCSMLVGVVDHLCKIYGDKLYIIVVDAHVDVLAPRPDVCMGTAGMGFWFLSNKSPFWNSPENFNPGNVSVLGCQTIPAETHGISCIGLEQVKVDVEKAAADVLARIPTDAKILLHFDVDVVGKQDMPAAYAPSETGLSMAACGQLLTLLLADNRCLGMELTEFSAIQDKERRNAQSLVAMLANVLGSAFEIRKQEAVAAG